MRFALALAGLGALLGSVVAQSSSGASRSAASASSLPSGAAVRVRFDTSHRLCESQGMTLSSR